MELSFIWKAFILIIAGILLLRIAGRKSISQMTLAQTIVMISIGTIIVQPIVEKSVMKAIVGAAIFVVSIVILEYVEIKFNLFEKFITGKSKIVIENGVLNTKNLKKLRLTVDQLEMRMRNQGIAKIEDVKTATLEPNGLLGYELKDHAKPLTVGEFKKILDSYFQKQSTSLEKENENIFEEINSLRPQNHPDYLQ
ncbi:MAG: YetF domain-containing protein [Bacillus sp. (in: firmicutes)]